MGHQSPGARNYRDLRGDFGLALAAVRRVAELPRAFRIGFLAAVFLVALRALVDAAFAKLLPDFGGP